MPSKAIDRFRQKEKKATLKNRIKLQIDSIFFLSAVFLSKTTNSTDNDEGFTLAAIFICLFYW